MTIWLFEDDAVGRLDPIAIGKPAFAVSCGSYRLWDLLQSLGRPMRAAVRPHLQPIVDADFAAADEADFAAASDTPMLLANARLVPSATVREALKSMLEAGIPGVVRTGEQTAAAIVGRRPSVDPSPPVSRDAGEFVAGALAQNLPEIHAELPLLDYPHDVIREHGRILRENLDDRLARGEYRQREDGVFVAGDAQLGEHVVADTRGGPILIESGARVGPYCYLSGPAHLGARCRVNEHAAIKDHVCLGHTTKIGGEIEASVIEPYTNKQHHGFLGHSYLGSWINLGAGTCNSDLKNTYGVVKMQYGSEKIETGMQFIGCVIGDYSKTAINTGIFTGKTIGVCSMVYGFVTTNVPSFVNYARLFGQVTETPVEVMIATQARMFARRDVQQRPCDIELLRAMYERTRAQRQLADEPLSL
jgi:glucose-1-phosphate thymidylyltransferase